uniref:Cytochrome c oxidase subunit 3 n=1 Tax=Dollfustrema vaneyi TaxID=438518 RepID=A0AAU7N3P4_9TREM
MSWLPIFNSWLICFGLISLFFWNLGVVLLLVPFVCFSVYFLLLESLDYVFHNSFSFWLFIMSEVLIFLTLFFLVFYNQVESLSPLSSPSELPFLGCFLLIGSSIVATCYHHCIGLRYNNFNLFYVIVLGGLFIFLQLCEFYDSGCDIFYDSFYCSSFCTVGLHFCHVVVGLVLLSIILFWGTGDLNRYYTDLAVWYWHFVDYIWLFVFFIVYCTCV